jgi:hypothetical protein
MLKPGDPLKLVVKDPAVQAALGMVVAMSAIPGATAVSTIMTAETIAGAGAISYDIVTRIKPSPRGSPSKFRQDNHNFVPGVPLITTPVTPTFYD